MISRRQWRRFIDKPLVEWGIFALGVLLVIVGFIVAPLPGPGGIFFIAPGLALILKTSMWAKRHYVRVKRWQPTAAKRSARPSRRAAAIDFAEPLAYRRARQRLPPGRPFFFLFELKA